MQWLAILLFFGVLGYSARKRRWRRLAFLLSFSVVAAALLVADPLWSDVRHMDPDEHFSWKGWYYPWVWGINLVVAVVLLWALVKGIARAARRVSGRARRTGVA